ncbi:hypothetical protein [Aeromonas phage vB_ AhaP_PT2]|uniref:Uncharacterized protein n=1 Tax=Aeromonas phage vB_ AhaP_PT2 TaxID=2924715 RepID=A0AC61TT78_9CAUD|nr:hypothetical protein [Aeromonas phage vB_ AhaP_PT2]
MNNAMPVLNVAVTMHNHDSHAGVIITRDGLVVSISTIAQGSSMLELVSLVNGYRCVNERVKYRIHRNTANKR